MRATGGAQRTSAHAWIAAGGVLLASLLATPAHARTWIAAVASDRGLPGELPLHFAESDARAVLATLAAAQPDPDHHRELLLAASPDDVRALLDRWRRDSRDDDVVILFLTGHGDHRGAHLGGEVLPWTELDQRLTAVRARVSIAIVDTCQSGALLGPKGFVRAPSATVRLEPRGPRGRYYLTSSGANEVSHESARVGGSPFAHHLISALRGAADEDGDGAITVSEAYRHVYARTVASTLDAPLGPQRPEQSIGLTGAGEVVLARTAGAQLHGSPARACWVLDAAEERVLAEVYGARSIALPPGRYVVKCAVDEASLDRAEVTLDGEAWVERLSYGREPLRYALAKGASPSVRAVDLTVAGAARVGDAPDDRLRPALMLGATLDTGAVAFPVQVILQNVEDQLDVHALVGAGYRIPWWQAGRLDVGVELGGGTRAALFGQFVRWELPLLGDVRAIARADLLTTWSPRDERRVALGALLSIGVALPVIGAPGNSPSEQDTP